MFLGFKHTSFSINFYFQLEKAGETYRKLKRPIEGSRCYEQLGKFNLAVETLVENDLYEMAIDTLRRYKSLRKVSDIYSYKHFIVLQKY